MQRMPFKVPLDAEVGNLAAGERQKTEIVKQLYLRAKIPGAGRADLRAHAAGSRPRCSAWCATWRIPAR